MFIDVQNLIVMVISISEHEVSVQATYLTPLTVTVPSSPSDLTPE